MSSPSSHSIIEEDGVVELGKLLTIIKYLSICSLIYGMKILSLTSSSVGRGKPHNIPSYHAVKVDILGMNSSSLEMAVAGSLAYRDLSSLFKRDRKSIRFRARDLVSKPGSATYFKHLYSPISGFHWKMQVTWVTRVNVGLGRHLQRAAFRPAFPVVSCDTEAKAGHQGAAFKAHSAQKVNQCQPGTGNLLWN